MSTLNSIWQILDSRKKKQFLGLFFLLLVGSILEIMSIGMILPVLTFLAQDLNTVNLEMNIFSNFLEILSNYSKKDLLKYSLIIFCCIYLFRSFFLFYLNWIQNNFIYGWKVNLSNAVFKKYLFLPYIFHLKNNSAELQRNVVIEVDKCVGLVNHVLLLLLEIFVLTGIVIMLLFISWEITLSIFSVLGIFSLLFYFGINRKIEEVSKKRFISEGSRLKYLKQGLNGIKDIKIYGKISEFLSKFSEANIDNQKSYQIFLLLQKSPRFIIESSAVLFISITTLVLFNKNMQFSTILPIIGIFVLSSIRLIPALNKIINFYNAIKYDQPSLNSISKVLNLQEKTQKFDFKGEKNDEVIFEKNIKLKNISHKYDGKRDFSIKEASFEIKSGEFVAFVGRSGSGKTTLADIILGLLEPNTGHVLVDEKNIFENLESWQNLIGYVPQQVYLTDDTLKNNIAYGFSDHEINDEMIWDVIKKSQLSQLVEKLPKGIDTFVGEFGKNLSGGEKQRIGIARALYKNPKLIFLDESTNSLDEKTESQIFDLVEKLKREKTIIFITHKESLIRNVDSIFSFSEGEIEKIK